MAKKKLKKPTKSKWLRKHHITAGITGLVIAAALFFYLLSPVQQNGSEEFSYDVSEEGKLSFGERGEVDIISEEVISDNERFISKKVIFRSYNADIYGFFIMPKSAEPISAAVILPPELTSKSDAGQLTNDLTTMGVATFTIDQRGAGETGGKIPGIQQDYETFLNMTPPAISHLMIYDALLAFDYLQGQEGIDKKNIFIAGESLGGKNAIITAAIEKSIAGVVVSGTAGFDFEPQRSPLAERYLKSIDANTYIAGISPRPLLMLHNSGDTVVSLAAAEKTFALAGEPKELFIAETGGHGYKTALMKETLALFIQKHFQ